MIKVTRKESTSDLQSRLKSRKLLGVGETSSGDIHISKVAQVLGNDARFAQHMTSGFQLCWCLNVLLLAGVGTLGVLWPHVFQLLHCRCDVDCSVHAWRLHAAALAGLGYLCWRLLATPVDVVRTIVLKVAIAAQVLEAAISLWGLQGQGQGPGPGQCPGEGRAAAQSYVAGHVVSVTLNLYQYLLLSKPASLFVFRRIRASMASPEALNLNGLFFPPPPPPGPGPGPGSDSAEREREKHD